MLENKHSSGQAAYIFDAFDPLFLGGFIEEANIFLMSLISSHKMDLILKKLFIVLLFLILSQD